MSVMAGLERARVGHEQPFATELLVQGFWAEVFLGCLAGADRWWCGGEKIPE